MSKPVFLSADWRHLCLLNYEIDPEILKPHLPFGTELDFVNGKTYVSLVAFMFYRTKLFGQVPALFHSTFEEVNLRFYVVRRDGGTIKRGVVFVKEIVPKPFLAYVARRFYNENYVAMPMSNRIDEGRSYEYEWGEHRLKVAARAAQIEARAASPERWITEHYWGYTKLSEASTYEYEVKHPVWNLYGVEKFELDSSKLHELYGVEFASAFKAAPSSVFVADGSPVTVHFPTLIR
ncbi:MAG: DUF2071 domain-containing protein [Bdellovibrionota bacterium]